MSIIRVLMLGDICAAPGRAIFQKYAADLRNRYKADAMIVNGENSASTGKGITSRIMKFFKHHGVDVVTSGNHIWAQREVYGYLAEHTDLLRPANYPSECPGVGITTFEVNGATIGVINMQGRVFMREFVSCPFKATETALAYLKHRTKIIIIDFHAEATAEKIGYASFVDGSVSAVVGTHTHVLTDDARILPGGTAFVTDLGMAGALDSMIGMKKEPILQHMITQMPIRFEVQTKGPLLLTGACISIDTETGKATQIEPIKIIDDTIHLDDSDEFAEKRRW